VPDIDKIPLPTLENLSNKLNNLGRSLKLYNLLDKHKKIAFETVQKTSTMCREHNLAASPGDVMSYSLRFLEDNLRADIDPPPREWVATLAQYATRVLVEGDEYKTAQEERNLITKKFTTAAKRTVKEQSAKFLKNVRLQEINQELSIIADLDAKVIANTFYNFYETAARDSNIRSAKKWGRYLSDEEVEKLLNKHQNITPLVHLAIDSFLTKIINNIHIKMQELFEETIVSLITSSGVRTEEEKSDLKSGYAEMLIKNFGWRLKWDLGIKRGRRKTVGGTYNSAQELTIAIQAAIAIVQSKNQKITQSAVAKVMDDVSARQLRKWLTRFGIKWEKAKKAAKI